MKGRRRYFLDTEFIEDGRTIDLISIALVCEDGRELYLCNRDCDTSRASPWVMQHVVPLLPPPQSELWVPRQGIAEAVQDFVKPEPKPEFWAYYADYDWVAVCQLFGRMVDLPSHFPKFCMDLKQWSVMLGGVRLPTQEHGAHNALEDARWNRRAFYFLVLEDAAE